MQVHITTEIATPIIMHLLYGSFDIILDDVLLSVHSAMCHPSPAVPPAVPPLTRRLMC